MPSDFNDIIKVTGIIFQFYAGTTTIPGICLLCRQGVSLLIIYFATIRIVLLQSFCVTVHHHINSSEAYYLYLPAVTIHEVLFVGAREPPATK